MSRAKIASSHALSLAAVVISPDDDPLLGEGRAELAAPQLRLRRVELDHAPAHLAERFWRRAAVGAADGQAGRDLIEEAGNANLEELVEVRREDPAELDALEERLIGVGSEREHPLA